jgi:hypothetical protein
LHKANLNDLQELDSLPSMKDLHLLDITVVLLSEIIDSKFKSLKMKEIICKVAIHLTIAFVLVEIGNIIIQNGWQTTPFDRFYPV